MDDDLPLLEIYSKILAGENYQVFTSRSRSDALEWLESHPLPDIVLLDCRMHEMPNEDFKAALDKVIGNRERPRIVGFSSFDASSPFAKEMRSLFGEFMEKPSGLEEMVASIKQLCS